MDFPSGEQTAIAIHLFCGLGSRGHKQMLAANSRFDAPVQAELASEQLRTLYPINAVRPEDMDTLKSGIRVQEFEDEDYIYRLGEELNELIYVIKGTVNIMDIEKSTIEVLSQGDDGARNPFTHDVPASAVAVAKCGTRILRVDYGLLSSFLPADPGFEAQCRPGRKAEPQKETPVARNSKTEILEVPESFTRALETLRDSGRRVLKSKKATIRKKAASKPDKAIKAFNRSSPEQTAKKPVSTPAIDIVATRQIRPDIRTRPVQKVTPMRAVTKKAKKSVEPLPAAKQKEVEMNEYLRAISLFNRNEWAAALAAFDALYVANPNTILYRTYVTRCQKNMTAA